MDNCFPYKESTRVDDFYKKLKASNKEAKRIAECFKDDVNPNYEVAERVFCDEPESYKPSLLEKVKCLLRRITT